MNIHCYLTLVLLLLHEGVPTHTADGECGFVGDCETLVLAFTITPSLAECIIYGSLVSGCNFVSWNRITGTCLAYPGCEELDPTHTDVVSSSVDCPVCHVPGLCLANLVDQVLVDSEAECMEKCSQEPLCLWSTYLQLDDQLCILFEDCPSLQLCENCYSSTKSCSSSDRSGKELLYVDGRSGNVTLVSLDGSGPNRELPAYPGSSHYPAAVNYMEALDAVVACGGHDLADSTKCWTFNGLIWSPLPDMSQPHCMYDSPSLNLEQGWWWVTGRALMEDGLCSYDVWTSEIFKGDEWVPCPQHPVGSSSHYPCIVQLNATHSLYAGGDSTLDQTWLYDWSSQTWTESGRLNQGRRDHSCVVLEEGVLAVGGWNVEFLHSVELFDPVQGIWIPYTASIPENIDPSNPILFLWEGTVIALFDGEDKVYRLQEDGIWSALEGVLLPEVFQGADVDKATLVPLTFKAGF